MTAPALAARRLWLAFVLGLGLGLWYALLRPLRRRRSAPADTLFVVAAFCAWLYHGFGVCRGDLRLGYSAGLLLGAVLLDRTLGVRLEPLFSTFWKFIGKILELLLLPGRIFFGFTKKTVASGGKWVKIKWNNRRHFRRTPGG